MSGNKHGVDEYNEPPKAFNMKRIKVDDLDALSDVNEGSEILDQTDTDVDIRFGEKANYRIGDGMIHLDQKTFELNFMDPERVDYKENKQD